MDDKLPRISILTGDLKGTFLTFLMWKGRTTESSKSLSFLYPSEAGKPWKTNKCQDVSDSPSPSHGKTRGLYLSVLAPPGVELAARASASPALPDGGSTPKFWNRSIWWICIHHGKTPTPDFTTLAPFPSKDPPISFTLESPNWLRPRSCSGASPTWWSRIRQRIWTPMAMAIWRWVTCEQIAFFLIFVV